MTKVARALIALVSAVGIAGQARQANAEPAPPIAAVFVVASLSADAFVPAYAYEISAEHLRQAGFAPTPPQVAGRALARRGGAGGCVANEECLLDAALELGAVVAVVLRASSPESGIMEVSARALRVGSTLTEVGNEEARGDLTAIAESIRAFVQPLVDAPAACLLHLVGSDQVEIRVNGEPVEPRHERIVVPPGDHELIMSRVGRASWSGSVHCEPGRRFRVTIR